jgi:hypothetical protein
VLQYGNELPSKGARGIKKKLLLSRILMSLKPVQWAIYCKILAFDIMLTKYISTDIHFPSIIKLLVLYNNFASMPSSSKTGKS